MAKEVVKVLTPYLYFHSHDINAKTFSQWIKKRKESNE